MRFSWNLAVRIVCVFIGVEVESFLSVDIAKLGQETAFVKHIIVNEC